MRERNYSELSKKYKFSITVFILESDYNPRNPVQNIRASTRAANRQTFRDEAYLALTRNGSTQRLTYSFYGILSKRQFKEIWGQDRIMLGSETEKRDSLRDIMESSQEISQNAVAFINKWNQVFDSCESSLAFYLHNVWHDNSDSATNDGDDFSRFWDRPMRDHLLQNKYYQIPFGPNCYYIDHNKKTRDFKTGEGTCVIDFIAARYGRKYLRGKNTRVTHYYTPQEVFRYIKEKEFDIDEANQGLTFDDVKKFVQQHLNDSVIIIMFSSVMFIERYYIPENLVKNPGRDKVTCCKMYFISTNGHMIPLCQLKTNNQTSAHKLLDPYFIKENGKIVGLEPEAELALVTTIQNPSNHYCIRKKQDTKKEEQSITLIQDEIQFYEFLDDQPDLYIPNPQEKEKKYYHIIFYNGDVHNLFMQMIVRVNVRQLPEDSSIVPQPTAVICDNICEFKVFQFHVRQYKNNVCNVLHNDEDVKAYSTWEPRIYKSIINIHNMSFYHPMTMRVLQNFLARPCVQLLDDLYPVPDNLENKNVYGLDYNKHYTSLFLKMKKLPIINEFDYFVRYDGHAIQNYTMYVVEGHWRQRNYWICFGMNLKIEMQRNHIKIISYLRPSTLRTNYLVKKIKGLYQDTTVNIDLKKLLINKVSGLVGKMFNSNFEFNIFFDKDEANAVFEDIKKFSTLESNIKHTFSEIMKQIDYSIGFWEKNEKPDTAYLIKSEKKCDLKDGFLPIRALLLDIATTEMFTLVKDVERAGLCPLYLKTDELMLSGSTENMNDFLVQNQRKRFPYISCDMTMENEEEWKNEMNEKKDTYGAIGYLKFSEKDTGHETIAKAYENRENRIIKKMIHHFKDNLSDVQFLHSILQDGNFKRNIRPIIQEEPFYTYPQYPDTPRYDRLKKAYLKEVNKTDIPLCLNEVNNFFELSLDKIRPVNNFLDNYSRIQKYSEWDSRRISEVLRNYTIMLGDCAGAGKSEGIIRHAVITNKRLLIVCPTNNLCYEHLQKIKKYEDEGLQFSDSFLQQKYEEEGIPFPYTGSNPRYTVEKGQIQTCTRHKLFGETCDENIRGIRVDSSEFDIILLDEIFMYEIKSLATILKAKYTLFEGKEVYAAGDLFQLRAVNEQVNNVEDYDQYMIHCVVQIFPYCLRLRKNKRCPDPEEAKQIEHFSTFVKEKTYEECLDYIQEQFNDRCYDNIDQLDLNIVQHAVSHDHVTRQTFNDKVHNFKYPNREFIYEVGDLVICFNQCTKTVEIDERKVKVSTKRQAPYIIHDIQKNNKDEWEYFVYLRGEDPNDTDVILFIIEQNTFFRNFTLPYARTCNSYQGGSFNENTAICNLRSDRVNCHFLNTALTRCTKLSQLYFVFDEQGKISMGNVRRTINNCFQTDRLRFPEYSDEMEENFVVPPWVYDRIKYQQYNCACCHESLIENNHNPQSGDVCDSQWTIDRKDNSLPHYKNNCFITCLSCNRSRGDREDVRI